MDLRLPPRRAIFDAMPTLPPWPPLEPGDTIVPLASLGAKCGALTGAVALGQLAYRADCSGPVIMLCVVIGFVVGLVVGIIYGRFAYPVRIDQVVVARAGRAAPGKTVSAALVPSLLVALILATIAPLALGGPTALVAAVVGGLSAVSVGSLFAIGAALG